LTAVLEAGCRPVILCLSTEALDAGHGLVPAAVRVMEAPASILESLDLALSHVDSDTTVVHDIAHPFATATLVRAVADAASASGAAAAAVPMDETLKLTEAPEPAGARLVSGTVDRSGLWKVQSPHAFRTQGLRALCRAEPLGGETTVGDLVRRAPGSCTIVPGERANVKLSTEPDLELAAAIATTMGASASGRGRAQVGHGGAESR